MNDEVTVGIAISIPQPHAGVLAGWRKTVGDPAAEQVWPHVTLLPPTAVPAESMVAIEKHLAQVAGEARRFVMHLAGSGTFRPASPVVFVQVARGVGECEKLEAAIRSGPLARELSFPYHPHVTVAQDVNDAALDEAYQGLGEYLARFTIDHFALFCRARDGGWNRRSEFYLGGGE